MDLYNVLGVERTADQDQIKRAYRRLASQHHPDKGGDTAKFQRIQSAYDILGDPQRRAEYDNPRPQGPAFSFDVNGFNFDHIFGAFNNRFNQARHNHVRLTLWISLHDVAVGGTRTVSIGTPNGVSAVEIEVPLGIDDGANVQYAGIGPGGTDLVVQYRVHPNPKWQRQGLDLITEQRVSVWDLVVGGTSKITDIYHKQLELQIPPNTQPGTMLRLKARGLRDRERHQGDVLVRLTTHIPLPIPDDIIAAIKKHYP